MSSPEFAARGAGVDPADHSALTEPLHSDGAPPAEGDRSGGSPQHDVPDGTMLDAPVTLPGESNRVTHTDGLGALTLPGNRVSGKDVRTDGPTRDDEPSDIHDRIFGPPGGGGSDACVAPGEPGGGSDVVPHLPVVLPIGDDMPNDGTVGSGAQGPLAT